GLVVSRGWRRRPHPTLNGEGLRKRDHDVCSVGRRHEQRKFGRLLRHPGTDHLSEVITTERLIGDDQYPAHCGLHHAYVTVSMLPCRCANRSRPDGGRSDPGCEGDQTW